MLLLRVGASNYNMVLSTTQWECPSSCISCSNLAPGARAHSLVCLSLLAVSPLAAYSGWGTTSLQQTANSPVLFCCLQVMLL